MLSVPEDKNEQTTKEKVQPKQPYLTPRLVIFGHLEELTAVKNPGAADGINSPIM